MLNPQQPLFNLKFSSTVRLWLQKDCNFCRAQDPALPIYLLPLDSCLPQLSLWVAGDIVSRQISLSFNTDLLKASSKGTMTRTFLIALTNRFKPSSRLMVSSSRTSNWQICSSIEVGRRSFDQHRHPCQASRSESISAPSATNSSTTTVPTQTSFLKDTTL